MATFYSHRLRFRLQLSGLLSEPTSRTWGNHGRERTNRRRLRRLYGDRTGTCRACRLHLDRPADLRQQEPRYRGNAHYRLAGHHLREARFHARPLHRRADVHPRIMDEFRPGSFSTDPANVWADWIVPEGSHPKPAPKIASPGNVGCDRINGVVVCSPDIPVGPK